MIEKKLIKTNIKNWISYILKNNKSKLFERYPMD